MLLTACLEEAAVKTLSRGERVSESTAVSFRQAVDNTKACSRSCSGFQDQRVGLAGLVAIVSVVFARACRFTHAIPCACQNATLRLLEHRHANLSSKPAKSRLKGMQEPGSFKEEPEMGDGKIPRLGGTRSLQTSRTDFLRMPIECCLSGCATQRPCEAQERRLRRNYQLIYMYIYIWSPAKIHVERSCIAFAY